MFVQCQVLQPIDIAKKIFAKEKFADMLYYISDEYKGVPTGQDLNDNVFIGYLLLEQNDNTAVVALAITDSTRKGVDWFYILKKKRSGS